MDTILRSQYVDQYLQYPGDLLPDAAFYLLGVGLAYTVVFAIGAIVNLFQIPKIKAKVVGRIINLAMFLVILLVIGDLFGLIWGEFIWGRFYISTDYINTDFLPFMPITQRLLDAPFGDEAHGLLGVTLFQLNLIWLVFAAATWGCTIALYRTWRLTDTNSPAAKCDPGQTLELT
jgi:hypothetical protein